MNSLHILLVSLIILYASVSSVYSQDQICNIHCDEELNPSLASNPRQITKITTWSREAILYISDEDDVAWAEFTKPNSYGDFIYLQRLFTEINQTELELGKVVYTEDSSPEIPLITPTFNLDDPTGNNMGQIRLCINTTRQPDSPRCSNWIFSFINATSSKADLAARALMSYYDIEGLWDQYDYHARPWSFPTALRRIINYSKKTNNLLYVLNNTFELNRNNFEGAFKFNTSEETLSWAWTWLQAYELTNEPKYLEVVLSSYEYVRDNFITTRCNGGIESKLERDIFDFKHSRTNGMFIIIGASLSNHLNQSVYLENAVEHWEWLRENLYNGTLVSWGLDRYCSQGGWVDNPLSGDQGIAIMALVELYKQTKEESYLNDANILAGVVINDKAFNPNGILREPECENPGTVCAERQALKGILVQGIFVVNNRLEDKPYSQWILNQEASIWENASNFKLHNMFGHVWAGPYSSTDADMSSQIAALDVFNAANEIGTH